MKKYIYYFFALALFTLISCANKPIEPEKEWRLVWADEFNYTGLPDATKWSYEEGFIRNKESQYYTKARKENAYVHDGYLEITVRKEPYKNDFYQKRPPGNFLDIPEAQYTSASINTEKSFSFKYGKVEMRAKLPNASGTWPALWMMGTDRAQVGWPKCGEIDILEAIGQEPGNVYATCHFPDTENPKKNYQSKGNHIHIDKLYEDFHIYTAEWSEDKIIFSFDHKPFFTFDIDPKNVSEDVFRKDFYILINLALGGWGGTIDDKMLPQSYLVDYIRVYQR